MQIADFQPVIADVRGNGNGLRSVPWSMGKFVVVNSGQRAGRSQPGSLDW